MMRSLTKHRPPGPGLRRAAAWIVVSVGLVLGTGAAVDLPTRGPQTTQTIADPPGRNGSVDSGDALLIRLVTVAPGTAMVSRFGHSALWIVDRRAGTSRAYGFGLSDFRQPGFLYQLVEGRVESWGGEIDAEEMLELYRDQNRRISVQTLNLSPTQAAELAGVLERETRPGGGFINYDFFRANCTTAIRDVIDEALEGRLRAATAGVPAGTSYRSSARAYTVSDLPLHSILGLTVVNGVDRPIDAWEEMFLPVTLRDRLRELTIESETGASVPLVADETVLYESGQPAVAGSAPASWPTYAVLGILLGVILAALGGAARGPESLWPRCGFAALAGGWAVCAGLAGVFLVVLWGFTGQTLMHWNTNLLQTNPLLLLVAVRAWGTRKDPSGAARVAGVVVGVSALGLLLQLLPIAAIPKPPLVALALPVNLGLAWGLAQLPEGRSSQVESGGQSSSSRLIPATDTTP